jgi:hypothetical protein
MEPCITHFNSLLAACRSQSHGGRWLGGAVRQDHIWCPCTWCSKTTRRWSYTRWIEDSGCFPLRRQVVQVNRNFACYRCLIYILLNYVPDQPILLLQWDIPPLRQEIDATESFGMERLQLPGDDKQRRLSYLLAQSTPSKTHTIVLHLLSIKDANITWPYAYAH